MKKTGKKLLFILDVVCVLLIQYVMMQYSCIPGFVHFIDQKVYMIGINYLILIAFHLFLLLILQRWSISLCVSSILISIWSICNYYTIMYHGSPLFLTEVANMTTAFNVIGNYQYPIDQPMMSLILLILLLAIGVAFSFFLQEKRTAFRWKKWMSHFILLFASVNVLFYCLFGNETIKGRSTMSSYWKVGVSPYGILSCIIEDVDKKINYLNKPEGYNVEELEDITNKNKKTGQTPDVIVILNESFYDLNSYTDTKAEEDPLNDFYGIDNAIYGKAISPGSGGGTNDSEFELLTANSMYLLRNSAPFNYLDFTRNHNNIVQYFKDLGYTTTAMHPCRGSNYSRHIAYPALGFDSTLFEENMNTNYYGNRWNLDKDNYADLIDHYNAMDSSPRFLYLLTFQNHGGWEQNEPSYDTIHTSRDYGDLNDDINEYMTSVQMSAQAFQNLTDYYMDVDRPVMIIMVGDHAPAFINSLNGDGMTETEMQIQRQSVPYVIWANFKLEVGDNQTDYLAMNSLMPLALDMADMPMTTYQQINLSFHNEKGVFTKDGLTYDLKGNIGTVEELYAEPLWRKYVFMEYSALKMDHYQQELYE